LNTATPEQIPGIYASLEAQSIDVGLMEKADRIFMLPLGYMWSDIGSWSALEEVLSDDDAGNHPAGNGRLFSVQASGNIAYSEEGHSIALVGVDDLVVVATPDATLVCPKDRAQDVRRMVELLRDKAPDLV
ncbi:MAG: mannose-1-phosphate guanyltransferase, partial [Planctomycetes bacterium]|nr:mannose-1-phosphate guanyltransferase [Planctomycetota bacterium]